jgi:phosphohistidine phosphatase
MDLYLIRHAEAAPLGEGGVSTDADRPLTDLGREQARRVAAGLQAHGVRPGIFLTSPLLRARQTAEAILEKWPAPAPEVRVCEELEPGTKRRKLAKALTRLDGNTVALVGHEPDLSTFAAWLLGDRKIHLELAKAGVAYLRCADKPDKRSAALHWLVTVDWLGG